MSSSSETDETGTAEVEQTIDRINARANRIRDRELRRALSELNGLDPEEQSVVERLAERLTEQLLDPPREALQAATEHDDGDTVQVARRLLAE